METPDPFSLILESLPYLTDDDDGVLTDNSPWSRKAALSSQPFIMMRKFAGLRFKGRKSFLFTSTLIILFKRC